jgi:hypothetical protein
MLGASIISYRGWLMAVLMCTMRDTAKEAEDMRDLRRRFGRRSGRRRSSSGGRGLIGGVGTLELIIGVVAVLIVVVFLLQLID